MLSPAWKPVAVSLRVELIDAGREQETMRDVETSIARYLWSLSGGGPSGAGWPLGADVDPGELTVVAARVANVRKVNAVGFVGSGANRARMVGRACPSAPRCRSKKFALPELAAVSVAEGPGDPGLPPGPRALRGRPRGHSSASHPGAMLRWTRMGFPT